MVKDTKHYGMKNLPENHSARKAVMELLDKFDLTLNEKGEVLSGTKTTKDDNYTYHHFDLYVRYKGENQIKGNTHETSNGVINIENKGIDDSGSKFIDVIVDTKAKSA